MPNLLIVSATAFEIEPTLKFLADFNKVDDNNYIVHSLLIQICITGVGMVNTAFELGKLHGKNFDLVINAGVAGSLTSQKIGSVVNVTQDTFTELGAENDEVFLTIDELGFGSQKVVLANKGMVGEIKSLPVVSGITVNTVHGNEKSITAIKSRCKADIESMEGAAFIHAANEHSWTSIQLRAISNEVEKRNKERWDLPLAINNLNEVLIKIIKERML